MDSRFKSLFTPLILGEIVLYIIEFDDVLNFYLALRPRINYPILTEWFRHRPAFVVAPTDFDYSLDGLPNYDWYYMEKEAKAIFKQLYQHSLLDVFYNIHRENTECGKKSTLIAVVKEKYYKLFRYLNNIGEVTD